MKMHNPPHPGEILRRVVAVGSLDLTMRRLPSGLAGSPARRCPSW